MSATSPWTSGFPGHAGSQDAAEAERLAAERGAHPVVAGGRGIPLVEDEVQHLEHRGEAVAKVVAGGHLEGDMGLRERLLGPDDPLGDRGAGNQERPGDLLRGQPPEQPEGQRDPRLAGEHGVAAGEHQAEEVVAEVLLTGDGQLGRGQRELRADVAPELLVLALEVGVAAQPVDRPVLGGRHEPGARIGRDARLRPRLQRADQLRLSARSSARPTSRTSRARPAIRRADSIRQIASTAR